MISHSFDPNLVRPLATAENQFLQVLVERFRIRRKGKGFELQVGFNDESLGIWLRAAKRHILSTIPFERRATLQQRIEAFFDSNEESYEYHDPSFPFRLGNGGTLPVIHLTGDDYYCLFYRDSHPKGWNIANGGANTRHDLLHPDLIVERELREELIIVEPEPKPTQSRWYVFDWHDARLRDHPDFALAHDLWEEHFRRQGLGEFVDVPLPLKWSLPPDADLEEHSHDSTRIRFGSDPSVVTGQGFLNLNAEDFGIEFDRIAKLSVGPKAVFCDGELRGHKLLNRVVGLFAVSRIQDSLAHGEHHFLPDRVFWDGEDRTGDDPVEVINAYLAQRCGPSRAQLEENFRTDSVHDHLGDALDLCPVTRTIIRRHRRLCETGDTSIPNPGDKPVEVFVSFASEDRLLARMVFDRIAATNHAFFSDVTLTSGAFADQIDLALDSARAFVAVGSRVEHLNKSWVKYEWRNFHNDMQSGRKPAESPFFAFVAGIDPNDLPRPLREQTAIIANPVDPAPSLAQLSRLIAEP